MSALSEQKKVSSGPDGWIEDLRVLDLSGESGSLAGRILADLGADVVKIEPPGGDKAVIPPCPTAF